MSLTWYLRMNLSCSTWIRNMRKYSTWMPKWLTPLDLNATILTHSILRKYGVSKGDVNTNFILTHKICLRRRPAYGPRSAVSRLIFLFTIFMKSCCSFTYDTLLRKPWSFLMLSRKPSSLMWLCMSCNALIAPACVVPDSHPSWNTHEWLAPGAMG